MILEDYCALRKFSQKIEEIGLTVNDPNLFQNIEKACRQKQAFLFSAEENFAVLTFKSTSLFIWVAWSSMRHAINHYLPIFESMARDVGASHIEFWSIRKGFSKRLPSSWSQTISVWNEMPIMVWKKIL